MYRRLSVVEFTSLALTPDSKKGLDVRSGTGRTECRSLRSFLKTFLSERTAIGGQAGTSSKIENDLGFTGGISGAELAEQARQQAVHFGSW